MKSEVLHNSVTFVFGDPDFGIWLRERLFFRQSSQKNNPDFSAGVCILNFT